MHTEGLGLETRSALTLNLVTGTSNPQVLKTIIFLVPGPVLGAVLGGVLLQPQGPGALFEHLIYHFLNTAGALRKS